MAIFSRKAKVKIPANSPIHSTEKPFFFQKIFKSKKMWQNSPTLKLDKYYYNRETKRHNGRNLVDLTRLKWWYVLCSRSQAREKRTTSTETLRGVGSLANRGRGKTEKEEINIFDVFVSRLKRLRVHHLKEGSYQSGRAVDITGAAGK